MALCPTILHNTRKQVKWQVWCKKYLIGSFHRKIQGLWTCLDQRPPISTAPLPTHRLHYCADSELHNLGAKITWTSHTSWNCIAHGDLFWIWKRPALTSYFRNVFDSCIMQKEGLHHKPFHIHTKFTFTPFPSSSNVALHALNEPWLLHTRELHAYIYTC